MRALFALILIGLMAAPAAAQGRGRKSGKIPPGHMPSAGQCRVWYEGVPPGRQPAPTSCAEAERIASRDGRARVIYGDDRRWSDRDDRIWRDDDRRTRDDDGDRRGRGRAVPRTDRYPSDSRYPDRRYPDRRRGDLSSEPAFQRGYDDGRVKGREDSQDGDRFDPDRHSWYRSANRGYNSRYGTREQYAALYREGFRDGYQDAYRSNENARRNRPGWWPF